MDLTAFTAAVRNPDTDGAALLREAVKVFQERQLGYDEALHMLAECRPEIHNQLKERFPIAEINTE